MKIWANCIVKNEENFIWFAIMSVIDYVDRILVYDTGSKDKTIEIIKKIQKIKKGKIYLKQVGEVDKYQFTEIRQRMLEQSICDWIIILDGDEVWWENSIKILVKTLNEKVNKCDVIVIPFYNMAGDIYHYQPEEAGRYQLIGKKGHLTIKAINKKIPGLHFGGGPYGKEGLLDGKNRLIQERDPKKILFLDTPFMHMTHLIRSSIDNHSKYKHEIGKQFPENFRYPEVFYSNHPKIIPSPWQKISRYNLIKAKLLTPLRRIKRKVM